MATIQEYCNVSSQRGKIEQVSASLFDKYSSDSLALQLQPASSNRQYCSVEAYLPSTSACKLKSLERDNPKFDITLKNVILQNEG